LSKEYIEQILDKQKNNFNDKTNDSHKICYNCLCTLASSAPFIKSWIL